MHKPSLKSLGLLGASVAALMSALPSAITRGGVSNDRHFSPSRSNRPRFNKYAPRSAYAGSTHNPRQINEQHAKIEAARIERESRVFKQEPDPNSITSIKKRINKPRSVIRLMVSMQG